MSLTLFSDKSLHKWSHCRNLDKTPTKDTPSISSVLTALPTALNTHFCETQGIADVSWWSFFESGENTKFALKTIHVANDLSREWFMLNAGDLSKIVFHLSPAGRLDAFFADPTDSTKLLPRKAEGALSMTLQGFCITKDITSTSNGFHPKTDAVYWKEALRYVTTLDQLCLVAAGRTVLDIIKDLTHDSNLMTAKDVDPTCDYLNAWWDFPSESTAPLPIGGFANQFRPDVRMQFIQTIVEQHAADGTATFDRAKRSRFSVLIAHLIFLKTAVFGAPPPKYLCSANSPLSDAEAAECDDALKQVPPARLDHTCVADALRRARQAEHMLRYSTFYFAVPPSKGLVAGIERLIRDVLYLAGIALPIAHPSVPIPVYRAALCKQSPTSTQLSIAANTSSSNPPPAASSAFSFMSSPVHPIAYNTTAPLNDPRPLDELPPHAMGVDPTKEGWAEMVTKMQAVIARAQQLHHASKAHVANGPRLAFEEIYRFVTRVLPLPLPFIASGGNSGGDDGGNVRETRRCFWFEPRSADGAMMSPSEINALRVEITDAAYQLMHMVLLSPQAFADTPVSEDGDGEGESVGRNNLQKLETNRSSNATVLLLLLLTVVDAASRVVLPAHITALAAELKAGKAPRALPTVTRVLNGVPWGGGASATLLDHKVVVPNVQSLLGLATLNLAAPHHMALVRACHDYFASIRPCEGLQKALDDSAAVRGRGTAVLTLYLFNGGPSGVPLLIKAFAAHSFQPTAASMKVRSALSSQFGAHAIQYAIMLDTLYGFINNADVCGYLPKLIASNFSPTAVSHETWIPSAAALAVLPRDNPTHQQRPPLATEMDVAHIRQLIDNLGVSSDNTERLAAAATCRPLALRIFLSIAAGAPHVLACQAAADMLGLIVSTSTPLRPDRAKPTSTSSTAAAASAAALPLKDINVADVSPLASSMSTTGSLLDEIIAFPAEIFTPLHELLRSVVVSAAGAFDAEKARMLSRVAMLATTLIEAACFVLGLDPPQEEDDDSLATASPHNPFSSSATMTVSSSASASSSHSSPRAPPCGFITGISGTHRKRRAALSRHARHATELLMTIVLNRISALTDSREDQEKPNSNLFPDPLKLAAAMAAFDERGADLTYLHAARLAIVSLVAKPEYVLWFHRRSVAAGDSEVDFSAKMPSERGPEAFWTATTLSSALDKPLVPINLTATAAKSSEVKKDDSAAAAPPVLNSASCVLLREAIVWASASTAFFQSSDLLAAMAITSSSTVAVDALSAHLLECAWLVKHAIVSCERSAAAAALREKEEKKGDTTEEGAAITSDTTDTNCSRMLPSQILTAAFSHAEVASLTWNFACGTQLAAVKQRGQRFLAIGGVWRSQVATTNYDHCEQGRMLYRMVLENAHAAAGRGNADVVVMMKGQVNADLMRTTLPATVSVNLEAVVKDCMLPELVSPIVDAADGVFNLLAPLYSEAREGLKTTHVATIRKLVVHSTPSTVTPMQAFALMPSGNESDKLPTAAEKVMHEISSSVLRAGDSYTQGSVAQIIGVGANDVAGKVVMDYYGRSLSEDTETSSQIYFGRECAVLSLMKRMGDVAFAEPFHTTNSRYRSVKPFSEVEFYPEDGEGFIRQRIEKEAAKLKVQPENVTDPPLHDIPRWPDAVTKKTEDLQQGAERSASSASVARPIPAWLCKVLGLSIVASPWYETILPFSAVSSLVPTPLVRSHLWCMVVEKAAAFHERGAAASTDFVTIYGYPLPTAPFPRLTNLVEWLGTQMEEPHDVSLIKIAVNRPKLSTVVSKLSIVCTTEKKSKPIEVTLRHDADLISPFGAAVPQQIASVFAALNRIAPMNEIVAWWPTAKNTASHVHLPPVIEVPCAHLRFSLRPLAKSGKEAAGLASASSEYYYFCEQHPSFYIDTDGMTSRPCGLNANVDADPLPFILEPFVDGSCPAGLALRGAARGTFALLMPVVVPEADYCAVEFVGLLPTGDEFVPPSAEAAACLLMCLYRYTFQPMRALPLIRAGFINAGHMSDAQKFFAELFLNDLSQGMNVRWASHLLVDELTACCPTYATDLKVSQISYDGADFTRRYMSYGIYTLPAELRMSADLLFPSVKRHVPSTVASWEREKLLDHLSIFANAALVEKYGLGSAGLVVCAEGGVRSRRPFGDFSSHFHTRWHLQEWQNSQITILDNLADGIPQDRISRCTDGSPVAFLHGSGLQPHIHAGFLRLRYAFTAEKLIMNLSAIQRLALFTTTTEAEERGRVMQAVHVQAFTHHWTTPESREVLVSEEWIRSRWVREYRTEYYNKSHSRTAYKDSDAVEAVAAAAVKQFTQPQAPTHETSRWVACIVRSTAQFYVPTRRFVVFGEPSSVRTMSVTVKAIADSLIQPFGAEVRHSLEAVGFTKKANPITTFDGLPYTIPNSSRGGGDVHTERALMKQRDGLAAFKNADFSYCALDGMNREMASEAFKAVRMAVAGALSQAKETMADARVKLMQRNLESVGLAKNNEIGPLDITGKLSTPSTFTTAANLNLFTYVTAGASFRAVLLAVENGGGTAAAGGSTTSSFTADLTYTLLFASHAALVLAEALALVDGMLGRFATAQTPSPLTSREREQGMALLRTLSARRVYVKTQNKTSKEYDATFNPLCLYFEWCDKKILRATQHELLVKIQTAIDQNADAAEVHQLLMGEGKSSVIVPMLCLQYAVAGSLMVVSCPPQLVKAAEANLNATLLGPLARDVKRLAVSREKDLTESDVKAMSAMKSRGGVVLADPNTLKCVFALNPLDIANATAGRNGDLKAYASAVQLLHTARVVLDEVDETCDPLRSSLIFPCDMKRELPSSDTRWRLQAIMLQLLHGCASLLPLSASAAAAAAHARETPILSEEAIVNVLPSEMRGNYEVLPFVRTLISSMDTALATNQLTLTPHLLLVTPGAFEASLLQPLLPITATILGLWGMRPETDVFEDESDSSLDEEENEKENAKENGARAHHHHHCRGDALPRATLQKMLVRQRPAAVTSEFESLPAECRRAINLAVELLYSIIPHILKKQHRVQFGVVTEADASYLKEFARSAGIDEYIQEGRTVLAIPFEGKDQPSYSSEFSHPDVVVGLTITAHILNPLTRERDVARLLRRLKVSLFEESAPVAERLATLVFASFITEGLRCVIKTPSRNKTLYLRLCAALQKRSIGGRGGDGANNDNDADDGDDDGGGRDGLQLSDLPTLLSFVGTLSQVCDSSQVSADVFDLLRLSPSAACWFCTRISPDFLRLNPYTFTSCGGDLLSSITFSQRVGFSGTASDLIPSEVEAGCQHQAESEGKASSILLCKRTTTVFEPPKRCNDVRDQVREALLKTGAFNAIIDVGAMLTETNESVARWLLSILPEDIHGVVFFTRDHTKACIMRSSGKVVPHAVSGLAVDKQFVFYDQIHTRGQDVKHHPAARALVLLGTKADLHLSALAQGVFRMRGLGAGQSLTLLAPPEVRAAVESLVEKGSLLPAEADKFGKVPSRKAKAALPKFWTASDPKTHKSNPLTTAAIHAWALRNQLEHEKVAHAALTIENLRRALLRPVIEANGLLTGKLMTPGVAKGMRDPIGFTIPDTFSPKQKSMFDTGDELLDRFLAGGFGGCSFDKARELIEALRANEEANNMTQHPEEAAMDDDEGNAESALEALMEKDQQEHKVREKEVAVELSVQDFFARDGERTMPWTVAQLRDLFTHDITPAATHSEAAFALFASLPPYASELLIGGSDTVLKQRIANNPLRFSPNFFPYACKEGDETSCALHRRLRPINFILEMAAITSSSSSTATNSMNPATSVIKFPHSAQTVLAHNATRPLCLPSEEKAITAASLAAWGELPSAASLAEKLIKSTTTSQHRHVDPSAPHCQAVTAVNKTSSRTQRLATKKGKEALPSAAANSTTQNSDSDDGQPSVASSALLVDSINMHTLFMQRHHSPRRFIVVTLAEAAMLRRIISEANERGAPLIDGFRFALRDFNYGTCPSHTENGFSDDLPAIPFHQLTAALRFLDGNPLFTVAHSRPRVAAAPSINDPLPPPPRLFLRESSAAHLSLAFLGPFSLNCRVDCFEVVSKTRRRPDPTKLDWRRHAGARAVLTFISTARELLLSRLIVAEMLLTAKALGWDLQRLQSLLDPEQRGQVTRTNLLKVLHEDAKGILTSHSAAVGTSGEASQPPNNHDDAITEAVLTLLDRDTDTTVGLGDLTALFADFDRWKADAVAE